VDEFRRFPKVDTFYILLVLLWKFPVFGHFQSSVQPEFVQNIFKLQN